MTTTEAPPASVNTSELTSCPACGSHVLFTVDLDYAVDGGYVDDHLGVTPKQGDTITRCDNCAAFFVHAPKPKPATTLAPTTKKRGTAKRATAKRTTAKRTTAKRARRKKT